MSEAVKIIVGEGESAEINVPVYGVIKGQDGKDGYSPTATVTKSGSTATISITDKNGTTTATVSDGQDGAPGVTYTPSVSADGEISWTNDGGLPNPQPRNITGPQGEKLTYTDLTPADKADLIQGPIAGAQTAAVAAVNSAGTTQISAVNQAGTAQVGNVNTAGAAQVQSVNTAGATQVQAVEGKGEEVLNSIPPDYSALASDVEAIEDELDGVATEATAQQTLTAEDDGAFWLGRVLMVIDGLADDLIAMVEAEIAKLPQDENGQAIAASIGEGNSWLNMLYHELEVS